MSEQKAEWRMVPVEPTPEMLDAVNGVRPSVTVGREWVDEDNRAVWAGMLEAAPQPPALAQPDDPWRDAVEDALVTCHLGTVETFGSDPARCLHELLTWHQQVALDPAVSSDAQALIDRGRADAAAIVRQLVAALKALVKVCKAQPSMQGREFVDIGSQSLSAIAAGKEWLEGK